MSQLYARQVREALLQGLIVAIENHNKVDMLRRYDWKLEPEDLVLKPGEHEFNLISLQIGNSSPTEWLVLRSPEKTDSHEGASLGYFLSLHNNGKITMHLQAPAANEAETVLEAK